MNDQEIKEFVKERDAAVESMDIDTFKEFHRKGVEKGWHKMPLPDDEIIEIAMRKMAVHSTNISDKVKAEATEWLITRGYSADI